jgi:hypothetical protein
MTPRQLDRAGVILFVDCLAQFSPQRFLFLGGCAVTRWQPDNAQGD